MSVATTGQVYIARDSDGLVKVGFSKRPSIRMFDLRAELQYATDTFPNALRIEKLAHKLLSVSAKRIASSEWFEATLEEAIEAVERAIRIADGSEPIPDFALPKGRRPMVGARIERSLFMRLKRATDRTKTAYAPSVAKIIERGIELALAELEKKAPR